jgi:ketosteroid isomerase-like protein
MSEENVAIVRKLVEMFAQRQHERALEYYDPDVVFDASRMPQLDIARIYHGREGVQSFWRAWLSAWSDLHFELGDILDAGDQVVAIIRNQRQWGRESGIETSFPDYGIVFTVRNGKVVRWCGYPNVPDALEAVGLTESSLG